VRILGLLLWLLVLALTLPALPVTVARLSGSSSVGPVLLTSFTPYALVPYALAFLVAAIGAVLGRRSARLARGAAALGLAVLLGLHLLWVSPQFVGGHRPAGDSDLTVMSSNLSYGEADPARVVDLAVDNAADVLVLLEVTPEAVAALDEAGMSSVFPHRAGKAVAGVVGTMVVSRRPLTDVLDLGIRPLGFAMTVGRGSSEVRLIAGHPISPTFEVDAWHGTHRVLFRSAAQQGADLPTVVAGDFNATLDHEPMRRLEAAGFRSAAELANSGWQPTWPSSGEFGVLGLRLPSLLQIDHVLVDGSFAVSATETYAISGTDHQALVARLTLR
jgi:endonuclease/exonuclease/phosphatase (EEP) superfamily protein YafD